MRFEMTELSDVERALQVDVRAFLASHGFDDASVEPMAPTVEDAFIARMGAPDGAAA